MQEVLDELTQLHDRRSFLALLGSHILLCSENGSSLGLIVVDIDRFAQINVASGYGLGDKVLCHLADQLRTVTRAQDHAARIGDNRFAVILPRVLNRGHAELAVQKLFRLLEVPFDAGEVRLFLMVTAGVALCPAHATQAELLLGKAELALAGARIQGNRYHFAPDASQPDELSRMWDIEMALSGAIDRGELRMHYQPQVRIDDLSVVGVEALMRWNSATRGPISPDVFIPLAERTGQIRKLTLWALNTVLRQAAQWKHDWGPLSVAVNVPSDLVAQSDLPAQVENALNLWSSESVRLVLEITERSLMDRSTAMEKLGRIRELGARISIDDFGTGYSCLAYFKNLPVDELKIDKSFVTALLTDASSADIATLIIDLAHRFGFPVVAEGVEDAATMDRLRAGGCDIAQGYFIARPMPEPEFQQWLRDYRPEAFRSVESS